MARFFPTPCRARAGRLALVALVAVAAGCDQNMSDEPLPEASTGDVSQVAARLSGAPSLSVPAGATISGRIELSPRVATLTAPSDVVFVMARDPTSEGPPLAVLRLTGNNYPMRFVLEASTATLSGAAPGRAVQLVVKVDKDGDAGTSAADDLLGFTADPVEPGDGGVIVLVEGTLGELARAAEQAGGTGPPDASDGRDATNATEDARGATDDATDGAAERGGAPRLGGTIALPPSLAALTSPDDVVFVIVREPGASGPPVAVRRLEGNRYPMKFRLDDADLMLRDDWPPTVEVEVRVDEDGNATTRNPRDLAGRTMAPVSVGDADVRIELEG